MRSDKQYKEEAIKKAFDLIKFHKIIEFPPNMKLLCEKFGFKLIIKEKSDELLPAVKGTCVYDERRNCYVIIAEKEAGDRIIAHEMGHILLGHFSDGKLVNDFETTDKKYSLYETCADIFAETLLTGNADRYKKENTKGE